jgi:hypothetical protein
VRCLRLTASVQRSRRLKYRACALAVSQSRTIDIYSRVDGALTGLLARHLKSCDSVDYRLTAGEGVATAGERDTWRQQTAQPGCSRLARQTDRLPERRRAMIYLSRSWASRAITSVDFNAK